MRSSVGPAALVWAMLIASCASYDGTDSIPDSGVFFDSQSTRCTHGSPCTWFGDIAYRLTGEVDPAGTSLVLANLTFLSGTDCFLIPITPELYVELDNVSSPRGENSFQRSQLSFEGEAHAPESLETVGELRDWRGGNYRRTPGGDIVDVSLCDGIGAPTVLDPTEFGSALFTLF